MEQALYVVLGAGLALPGSIIAARIELRRSRRLRVLDELIPRMRSGDRDALDGLRRTCLLLSADERGLVDRLRELADDRERSREPGCSVKHPATLSLRLP